MPPIGNLSLPTVEVPSTTPAIESTPTPASTDTPIPDQSPPVTLADTVQVPSTITTLVYNAQPTRIVADLSLVPVFQSNFDDGSVGNWELGEGWSLIQSVDRQFLQAANSEYPALLSNYGSINIVVEVRVELTECAVSLNINDSSIGAYRVIVHVEGEVELWRNNILLASAVLQDRPVVGWHILKVFVLDSMIQVAFDNIEVLFATDVQPLPAGNLSINAVFSPDADPAHRMLGLDDVMIWVPAATLVQPTEIVIGTLPPPPSQIPTEMILGTLPLAPTETPTENVLITEEALPSPGFIPTDAPLFETPTAPYQARDEFTLPCALDFDHDGLITDIDLAMIARTLLNSDATDFLTKYDLNGNSQVDIGDLQKMSLLLGSTCPARTTEG